MDQKDRRIGMLIKDNYEILEKIGAGGMATVYKCLQKNLNRPVALKIINDNYIDDEDLLKRFYREAQDIARISHPNVVTVFDFGSEGDIHFIAMEYLEGMNLSRLIRQKGKIDEYTAVKYIAPIADALYHIHELDFIHRDVKSSNIFITNDGRPVLMDFGIAFHSDNTISDISTVLGTAEYMSPEQTKGSALDIRSDLYSLGIVLYECVTGKVPFHGDSLTSTIYKVNHDHVEPLSKSLNISEWLEELIMSLLQKSADDRPDSAREVYETLERGLDTGSRESFKRQRKNTANKKAAVKPEKKKSSNTNKKRSFVPVISMLSFLIISIAALIVLWSMGILDSNIPPQRIESAMDNSFRAEEPAQQVQNNESNSYPQNVNAVADQRTDSDVPASNQNSNIDTRIVIDEIAWEIRMIDIPGNSFLMGDSKFTDNPEHKVDLSSFKISEKEVTLKQFVSLMNAYVCDQQGNVDGVKMFHPELLKNHLTWQSNQFVLNRNAENFPAYGITWSGANFFCRKLDGRLPTEAEWEYVARTGENVDTVNSNSSIHNGWYNGKTSSVQPVGSLTPSALGLFDMKGNVWEWCFDYYSDDYYTNSVIRNPKGPATGDGKVIRGGDIHSALPLASFSYRSFMYDNRLTNDLIGFRFCQSEN